MKNIFLISFTLFMVSCNPFSKVSNATKFEKADGYTKVYNSQAGMQSLTFGDFQFAVNRKEFKKLNESNPDFKNILFYAMTTDVPYEYYMLYNPNSIKKTDKYFYKDTIIANDRFILAITKNAPGSDVKFIMDNITTIK